MTAAVALFGYAALLLTAGASGLARAGWADRAPRLAVAAWLALTGSAVASVVLGGMALVMPTVRVSAGLAAPGGGLTPRARALAAQMGDLASGMWSQAADAWYQRDRSTAAALAGRAQEMDELHASLAAELAAGQVTAPAAMETTLVARCYRRLGAHAVNIARRSAYLAGSAGE